jgi:ATP-dependent Clp protease ATP-binding subunit ClpA
MTSPAPSGPFSPGFSGCARRIIELANAEGLQSGGRVDDVHILVGLLAEGGSEAARMLNVHGLSLADVRSQVTSPTAKDLAVDHVPFTPSARAAVKLAQKEAAREGPPRSFWRPPTTV